MTVRTLINKLLEIDDLNAEVSVYVEGTKLQLKDRIEECDSDDDYVLDDYMPITEVEVHNKAPLGNTRYFSDGSVTLHILDF